MPYDNVGSQINSPCFNPASVDRLLHGEPAVVLSGLLEAKISLQPFTEEAQSMKTEPVPSEPISPQQSTLSRAARARKSYSMDEDDEDE